MNKNAFIIVLSAVKALSGEVKVETQEGEGSEFMIQLPNHSS
jgi:chemotaxis protein histidine kinase CheA